MAVLFADISGFTELVESAPPEIVYQVVRPLMDRLVLLVRHHDGDIQQVLGDGFMAVFGLCMVRGDEARRAIRAGLALLAAVGQSDPAVHVGIEYGKVRSPHPGSPHSSDSGAVPSTSPNETAQRASPVQPALISRPANATQRPRLLESLKAAQKTPPCGGRPDSDHGRSRNRRLRRTDAQALVDDELGPGRCVLVLDASCHGAAAGVTDPDACRWDLPAIGAVGDGHRKPPCHRSAG